jgi:hypothetical protein
VGFFGLYVFDGTAWHSFDPGSGETPDIVAPWLSVNIHDSDFAEVRYEPPGPGSGTAYLGFTPRAYFQDDSASAPTDVSREAEGLAVWLVRQQGRTDEAALQELVASFLADDSPEDLDDAGLEDDADIFVEVKVSKFLTAVGVPAPDDLPGA